MNKWTFCDDLGAPEICVCLDKTWWRQNYLEILTWLTSESDGRASLIGDDVLFIQEDTRALFILRFGP